MKRKINLEFLIVFFSIIVGSVILYTIAGNVIDLFWIVGLLIVGFILTLILTGSPIQKIHKNYKLTVTFSKCKSCKTKFGVYNDGHSALEYHCTNQPKWFVTIFGKKWFYCNDVCLSKHFYHNSITNHYDYYKSKPHIKFRLRLTNCYKQLNTQAVIK